MKSEILDDKRAEWNLLLKKGSGTIRPQDFLENARRKSSAFNRDYTWDPKQAIKEYYEKRTANLIMHYSTVFNTTDAHQRLHAVRPMLPSGKKAVRKVYRVSSLIVEDKDELNQIRAQIWSRLRRVARDIHDFSGSLPELRGIGDFLLIEIGRHDQGSSGAAAN